MNFTLRKPCLQCPFRTDCLQGWLGAPRAKEIVEGVLLKEQTFPCHKTTKGRKKANWEMCAGAAIMSEKSGRSHWLLRLATGLGLRDPQRLDLTAPVFESAEEMIEHHR